MSDCYESANSLDDKKKKVVQNWLKSSTNDSLIQYLYSGANFIHMYNLCVHARFRKGWKM